MAKQMAALPSAALARECLTNLETATLTESQLAHLVEAAEQLAYGRAAAPRPGGAGERAITDPSGPLMAVLRDIPQLPLRCVTRFRASDALVRAYEAERFRATAARACAHLCGFRIAPSLSPALRCAYARARLHTLIVLRRFNARFEAFSDNAERIEHALREVSAATGTLKALSQMAMVVLREMGDHLGVEHGFAGGAPRLPLVWELTPLLDATVGRKKRPLAYYMVRSVPPAAVLCPAAAERVVRCGPFPPSATTSFDTKTTRRPSRLEM